MAKEYRPILNIPTTPREKIYDGISLGLVAGMVVVMLWSFLHLPDIIPVHWNFKGEADGFGGRFWIALIPILSIIYAFGNSKVTQIPHQYNYLKKITKDNVEEEYVKGRKLLRLVHLIAQFVFFLIVINTIRGGLTDNVDFGTGFVPIVLITILSPVIYSIYNKRE